MAIVPQMAPPRNRDAQGNIIDPAMEPDLGVGVAPPRDPYMAAMAPSPGATASDRAVANMGGNRDLLGNPMNDTAMGGPTSNVTRLEPSRQRAFSRADAQALLALDPRALDEAESIAANPNSLPPEITGSFGGKSYSMQPRPSVDRKVLATLYAQAQQRKAQERQDSVRGQEQSGKERIVSIPGEQLGKRRDAELAADASKLQSEQAFKAPERDAKIAESGAAVAKSQQDLEQGAQTFAERDTPEIRAAQEIYQAAQQAPDANTPAGQARIAKAYALTKAGQQGLPGPTPQGPDIGASVAQIEADPGIAALKQRYEQTKPRFLSGSKDRATNAAARSLLTSAIQASLQKMGIPQDQIDAYLAANFESDTPNTPNPFAAAMGNLPGPVGTALSAYNLSQR